MISDSVVGMISDSVVILTREEFDAKLAKSFTRGVERGKFEAISKPSPEVPRPNWCEVYDREGRDYDADQQLISATRETLRLARSALQQLCEQDYYHNYGAARAELSALLETS